MSNNNHPIALITDSTCDIPSEMIKQYGIYVTALYVIWGQEQYRDQIDITSEQLYRRLENDPVHPSTSQPTPKDFVDMFERVKADGAQEAVVITISDGLSGTLDSARQAAELVDFPVHLHDGRSASIGTGWQVLAAARAREAGGDAQAMLDAAEMARRNMSVFFTVDTLEFLHKGGRIGAAAKMMGTALQLKPTLIVNNETGLIDPGVKIRTRKKALKRIYNDFFANQNKDGHIHVAIIQVNAEEEARELAEEVQREFKDAEVLLTAVSPVIGIHGGPGTIGIGGYHEDH